MPENETRVFPFRGLRYDVSNGCPLEQVTAPPFDAIDKPLQQLLYRKHPNNTVRLDLNQVTPSDSLSDNAYIRARDCFQQWQKSNILIPEEKPAIYTYQQRWRDENGKNIDRKGIILLLEVEPYASKRVLPHENTLIGPKSDRLNLLKLTLGNFSPIFMAYSDPDCSLEKNLFTSTPASQSITDLDGVTHILTPVYDPKLIQSVQQLLKNQQLLIADGHHRYETAIAFMEDARERYRQLTGQCPQKGGLLSDYTLVYLANIHDSGLMAYPIHRLIQHWPEGVSPEPFEIQLLQHFDVVTSNEDFTYLCRQKPPISLRLKSKESLADLPHELHRVDTAILEQVVFKGILGANTIELKASQAIGFSTDLVHIREQLKNGQAEAAFIMNTPQLSHIKEACACGIRMPLKSTYFYPKLLTGLVFYGYTPFLNQKQPTHAISDVVFSALPLPVNAFDLEKDRIDYHMALIPD